MHSLKQNQKLQSLSKTAYLPLAALVGLLLGILFFFAYQRQAAHIIWSITLIAGGAPIAYQTLKGMLKGQFASDIVALLAIVTALLLGQVFAGAVVVLMQSGGEAIEAFGLKRATSSLTALLQRAPRIAHRKKEGGLEDIDVLSVAIGDTLIVRPGELVPVDGTVLTGASEIDESALTGEPIARNKTVGDHLLSGSINLNGALEMRADKLSLESQYAKIIELVKKAQEQKAPIQRLADRYAILFTPLTLVMAALGWALTQDATTALSVLVVATPCPLILATPLAVMCAINQAADIGIIVKGGAPIEQVASARAVLFDKTGTITYGAPFVEEIVPLNGETASTLLVHAAMIDQFSSHSVAKAIVKKALENAPSLPFPERFQEFPGRGVEGEVHHEQYLVGSASFLEERLGKACLDSYKEKAQPYWEQNKILIFVVKQSECIGFLVLSDKIRPGVQEMVHTLRQLDVEQVVMITGDSAKNAEAIGQQAGIATIRAELLPEQKVHIVKEYEQLYSPVIMVGDGINDAPALATATVGIAMGAYGTAVSAEAADIVLLVDDPTKVATTIVIGKWMLRIAKQSIFIGMGLSFALMIIACSGRIIPALGALLQEIIDVAVILNALRARNVLKHL